MTTDAFTTTIPSETAAGREVQDRIVALLEQHDYPMRDVFGMRLALEEAVVNAIKHGNHMDPDKVVKIRCEISDDRIFVEIEDEGEGFDLSEVPDPTAEENLDKPSGRGIMLMKNFMTRMEYNDVGNCLTLEKLRVDNGNGQP